MNTFVKAWKSHQETTFTENGGLTYKTSGNANTDLFFMVAALRGQGTERLYNLFAKAFGEDSYLATRIMLWSRDVRGGAGERQIFRDLLSWLEDNAPEVLELVIPKVPLLGRWDDLTGSKKHVFKTEKFRNLAYDLVDEALRSKNQLAAKWMPRRGIVAEALRSYFGLTPRQYRKVLVSLTNVVENKMCARDWSSINYEVIPSLAQIRYSAAFKRNDEIRYSEYAKKAKEYAEYVNGVMPLTASAVIPEKVKINAGAVYPYDVLKPVISKYGSNSKFDPNTVKAQWLSLPNYVGDANILPIVDVSGSMETIIPGTTVTAMDVSVSIGLYLATKNRGDFHNVFMTFSNDPELVTLLGEDIIVQAKQLNHASWGMSTNLEAAFAKVLNLAKKNKIPQADMPQTLLIISDMEFNSAASGKTAYQDFVKKYSDAGYTAPSIVWWNVMSRHDNVPVSNKQPGTALVSGFSPSIVKNILSGENMTPASIMLKTVMNPRYDLDLIKKAA